jgi:hypothetical protein
LVPEKKSEKKPAKKPETKVVPVVIDETARRARGPMVVSRLTDRIARTAFGKRGFTGAEIVTRWPEIVGADLAVFACPLQVKFPKGRNEGATLLLRVSSSAAATMLQLKTPVIVERVNRFFGYAAISRLEASHGPLPRPPAKAPAVAEAPPSEAVDRQTAGVVSEDVRAALRKLGARLQHRRGPGVVKPTDTPPSGEN